MKTIYKYILDLSNPITRMPEGATILTVQAQYGEVVVWAEVDPEAKTQDVLFEAFMTGQEMRTDMGVSRVYVGTVQINDGHLVFHIYLRH